MHHRRLFPLAVAALAAASLPAQQTKVVPAGMDFVEGPLVYTYPFGRADAGMQILCDADQITLGQGVITGIRFRPSQATQSSPAYTKNYRVTAYTVTATAATMATDPLLNIGTATGTVVWNGPLSLPATGPLTLTPAPFSIAVPFTPPYLFDGAQGNLLLLIETTDLSAVPSTYRIDAVQFRSTVAEGIVAPIDAAGCAAAGNTLAISAPAATAILGGAIDVAHAPSAAGAFTVALATLGLQRLDVDLAPVGLPGCTSRLGTSFALQLLLDTGSGLPHAQWPVPNSPVFEGLAAFAQAAGLPATGPGAAVSNALAIRLGAATPPSVHAMSAFRTSTGWFAGGTGEFVPVVLFEGVFP